MSVDRFDPSAHANYLTTLVLIGIALERLVPAPQTAALGRVVGIVRDLERWVVARLPVLRGRRKLWTEVALVGSAIVLRSIVFVLVHAFDSG